MDILAKLIEQLPSAVAIIIVVVYFIRYIQKRDEQETERSNKTLETLSNMAVAINTIAKNQESHHSSMLDAVSDMRSVTRRRKNERPD
jgi:hypothetical protein